MSKKTFLKDTAQNMDNPIVTGKYKGKWPKKTGTVNKSKEKSVKPLMETRSLKTSSLDWDCCCQEAPTSDCIFKVRRSYSWTWISGFFGNMERGFTGNRSTVEWYLPERMLSSPKSNPTHSSLPVSLPDAWQETRHKIGQEMGGWQSQKETSATGQYPVWFPDHYIST